MEVKRIGVLGAGLMGHGIAQVCATAGFEVVLRDIARGPLDAGLEKIERSLAKFVEKGTLTAEQARAARGRIRATTDLADAARTDFVIEAVPENLELKRAVFKELEGLAPPATLFASNTSQFTIASLAVAVERKDRFIGMHWFNPPQVMALIEIARTPETSEATLRTTVELSKRLGKDPVVCKDSKGFITTRAINAFRLECFRIWEEGVASPEEIDKAIRLAFRHPMGPFELADLVGLDTALAVEESLAETYGDRFRPPEALRRLVKEGKLGRKSGEGFYRHEPPPAHPRSAGRDAKVEGGSM